MSGYTPTTAEIRDMVSETLSEFVSEEEGLARFDRWLAAHEQALRAEGAADDREQWARKVAQELATTSVHAASYIGQMATDALDALLAMTRASVLAEAKAEALREAAEALYLPSGGPVAYVDIAYAEQLVQACLHARANAIEAGQP